MHAGSAPAFEFDSETAGTQQQALHFFRAEEGVAQEWQSSSVLLFFWGEEKVYYSILCINAARSIASYGLGNTSCAPLDFHAEKEKPRFASVLSK
eukprot:scaffold20338_cov140-Skeletonema_menzelii.AAC.3